MSAEKGPLEVSERPLGHEANPSSSSQQDQDEPKPATPPTFFEKLSTFFGDWYYFWEILGIVISAGAIAGICIVVSHFDNRAPPDWTAHVPGRSQPFRLTINSLLSIISVFGSTCAMIPVTKGLGQLKYLWFMEQDRKLADLEVFDSASRGKLGSAQLIWKLRFKHLAVLGGLASLLALAYGPFVQNLISIDLMYLPSSTDPAQISFTDRYMWEPRMDALDVDRAMRYAVETAMADKNEDWVAPPLTCKTGSCQWEPYYTTAACTRCTDITDRLSKSCTPFRAATSSNGTESGGCNVSLGNGMSFNEVPDVLSFDTPWSKARTVIAMNTTTMPLVYTDDKYHDPFVLVQAILAYDPNRPLGQSPQEIQPFIVTEDTALSAHECVIIPCVQRQRFVVAKKDDGSGNGGVSRSNELRPGIAILEEHDNYTATNLPSPDADGNQNTTFTELLRDTSIEFNSSTSKMSDAQKKNWFLSYIPASAYAALHDYLPSLLNDHGYTFHNYTSGRDEFGQDTTVQVWDIFQRTLNDSWTEPYCVPHDAEDITGRAVGFECAMRKLAAGITNGMRLASWELPADARRQFAGTTLVPQQICHAQWQYISAPLAVWALGLALFVGVVWKTRRANIKAWRTSPLATLLLRLDPDSREHLKDWQHMGDAELRETAEKLRLRLRIDEDGPPRFVRRDGNEDDRV